MKILIAEDDPVSSRLLTYTLTKLGYEVTAAPNGLIALEYFKEHLPPIVLSDWMMPELDGVKLCQRIRALKLDRYTFFMLLTAKSGKANYLQAMEAMVDDFLAKPVNPEELAIRLRVAERIIRQRDEAERAIRLLARFPADNPNPVLQVDGEQMLTYANAASLPLLMQWQCSPGGAVPPALAGLLQPLRQSGERQEVEVSCAERTFSFSATSISESGQVYLYGHDITDRKRAENELRLLKNQAEESALHDQLTGLPNRRLFADRLAHEIARANREGSRLALVVIDIDNFKQINDGYGHKIGDQVLVSVANCLVQNVRATDTVCRWGGDELVMILTDLKTVEDVELISAKLMRAVKQCAASEGITAPVSLSLGSAVLPDDSRDGTLLMQQADHALYQAKAEGRDCWRPFSGFADQHDARDKADLFLRLSAAVEKGTIRAQFQPLVDAKTHRVVGAEVLARWKDDQHGWVSPDVFIPLAEEKGLILGLGQHVLVQGLDQLRAWRDAGLELTLSVNLSRRQVLDGEFRNTLLRLVRERGLQPAWVVLEVTERQSMLDHTLGRQRLEELAQEGFRLSIADFGSGYSSLDLVGEFHFHELKIHIGLVRRIKTPKGRRIIQAIVEMGKALGLRVVAEGVEDQLMQALLTVIGVHKFQGYLFSKPLEAEAFLEFTREHNDSLPEAEADAAAA